MDQQKHQELRLLASDQHARGVENHHIEENLQKAGATPEMTAHIMKEIKTIDFIRRKKRGFRSVTIGSFLLVFGFLITLLLYHSGSNINYAMYSVTIAGVVMLLWGMIDIMGW
ncbi:MAG TPA: hypothetical protein VFU15_13140 [Bacteroidia bacterium]|nr:hypothetical protein [Bacteroidia bacterium]